MEPSAVKSKVGWLLSGPVVKESVTTQFSNLSSVTTLITSEIDSDNIDLNAGINKFPVFSHIPPISL